MHAVDTTLSSESGLICCSPNTLLAICAPNPARSRRMFAQTSSGSNLSRSVEDLNMGLSHETTSREAPQSKFNNRISRKSSNDSALLRHRSQRRKPRPMPTCYSHLRYTQHTVIGQHCSRMIQKRHGWYIWMSMCFSPVPTTRAWGHLPLQNVQMP